MQIKTARARFWLKPVLAVVLAGLADLTLWGWRGIGSGVGVLAAAILIAALVVRWPAKGDRRAVLAFAAAAILAAMLFDHPTLLAWAMFASAIGVAVLSKRVGDGGDAWTWLQRLVVAFVIGLIAPLLDLIKLRRSGRAPKRSLRRFMGQLILPLAGGGVFLRLFASANPLIGDALKGVEAPEPDIGRGVFWTLALLAAWMVLRPRLRRRLLPTPGGVEVVLPGVTTTSVGLSLILFNALFALQNGLDIAFLWSGAPLPGHVTLAGYAHKGAYTLIATAILAGVFVLIALQPGSAMARSRPLRWLVIGWVAQNLLLVASSALRTWDYVQSYSLTEFRIAALLWMGLVAVGLVLICWRMLGSKSVAWLINANTLAAGLVLAGCCVVDLGAVAAAWNVRNAREVGGRGVQLDLEYLKNIGDASLAPLDELLQQPLPSAFRARVDEVRRELLADLANRQASWRGWTWRGQRRLEAAGALAPRPASPPAISASTARPG